VCLVQSNRKIVSDASSATHRPSQKKKAFRNDCFRRSNGQSGAGSYSLEISVEGFPVDFYLNHNTNSGRVEVVRIMPQRVPDRLVKDFADDALGWEWVRNEFRLRRLPLAYRGASCKLTGSAWKPVEQDISPTRWTSCSAGSSCFLS
jgi:hypothetical protein